MPTLTEHWQQLEKDCQKLIAENSTTYVADQRFAHIIDTLISAAKTGVLLEGNGAWYNVPLMNGMLVEQHLCRLGDNRLPQPNSLASLKASQLFLEFIRQFALGKVTSKQWMIAAELKGRIEESKSEVQQLTKRIDECKKHLNLKDLAPSGLAIVSSFASNVSVTSRTSVITNSSTSSVSGKDVTEPDFVFSDQSKNSYVTSYSDNQLSNEGSDDERFTESDRDDTDNDRDDDDEPAVNLYQATKTAPTWQSVELYDSLMRGFRWSLELALTNYLKRELEAPMTVPGVVYNQNIQIVDDYESVSALQVKTDIQATIARVILVNEKKLKVGHSEKVQELSGTIVSLNRELENAHTTHAIYLEKCTENLEKFTVDETNLTSALQRTGKLLAEAEVWLKESETPISAFVDTFGEQVIPGALDQNEIDLATAKRNSHQSEYKRQLKEITDLKKEHEQYSESMLQASTTLKQSIHKIEKQLAEVKLELKQYEAAHGNLSKLSFISQLLQADGFFSAVQESFENLIKTRNMILGNCWATYSLAVEQKMKVVDVRLGDLQTIFETLSKPSANSVFEGFDFPVESCKRCRERLKLDWNEVTVAQNAEQEMRELKKKSPKKYK